MISKLKFFFQSTNEHGVHSPFVFKYVTECLYSKPRFSKNNSENVLLKSISYFGYHNFLVIGNTKFEETVRLKIPNSKIENTPFDLVYFENADFKKTDQLIQKKSIHNDSLIIVNTIHSTKKEFSEWNKLIGHPQISVSLDLFYCGVLFIRKEQEKEHFRIRL